MRFCLLIAALILAACQPADKKVKSVKERLEAGELVEFTKPGYRPPACNQHLPDWSDIRLRDESERERIVLKTQRSALNPGKYSCFRIGSIIDLNSPDKHSGAGKARITKLSIVALDKLQARNLKGSFFSKAQDFSNYKASVKLYPDHQGLVTIVDFEYIPDSAPDEKDIKEKIKREGDSDGLVETAKDGEFVSSCNAPWTELLAADNFHEALLNGSLKSFYRVGDLNCLAQGQQAEVKTKRGDASKGMVKILKVRKFRMAHLDASYFRGKEADFVQLEAAIKADKQNEWMTVMDVEPVAAAGRCAFRPNPVTIVYETLQPAVLKEPTWTAHLKGRTCYEPNEMVNVRFVFMDRLEVQPVFPALVKSQSPEGDGTALILENLGVIK
jgi:hypothetical protein